MKWILLACTAALAFAEGTEPKKTAEEYDVSGRSGEVGIGAEFMVHSFSGQGQMYISEDHLIVEVALYPPKGGSIKVDSAAFSLRVNNKKPALLPLTPQMFAASLGRSGLPFGMGMPGGGGGPGMGGPGMGGPGMGGPVPSQGGGGPFPRRTPPPSGRGGTDQQEEVTAPGVAVQSALPQGETTQPVSGFLYFAYRGKISGIKSLELVYDRTVLKLR